MIHDTKQMNTFLAIIVAWIIAIVICFVIGIYWFPPLINYPLNHSVPLAYLLHPLCKNNFNYRAKLNNEECINYTTLVFKDLLNYFHKEFDDTDVVKTIAKTYDNCFFIVPP